MAGVSLSTVDRVINERGGVSEARRKKVLETARQLGIKLVLPSNIRGILRFDVLIVDTAADYFHRVTEAFGRQAQLFQSRVVLMRRFWRESNEMDLVRLIKANKAPRQGLIVVGPDTAPVREALSEVIEKGTPTVLLTTNIEALSGATYVGIDNIKAGRVAARLMAHALSDSGKVLLITNSTRYLAHRQRIQGFTERLRILVPSIEIIGPIECHDDEHLTYSAVSRAQVKDPPIGIYNTGGGSRGIHDALGRTRCRPFWISHEASEEHARMLETDILSVAIDQDPDAQVQISIQHLLFANGDLETAPNTLPELRIVIPENLPE